MDKKIIVAILANFFVIIIAGIIDWYLELGEFSGIIFFLYSFYGFILIFLIYFVLGLWKKYYFKILLIPILFATILYLISTIIQS